MNVKLLTLMSALVLLGSNGSAASAMDLLAKYPLPNLPQSVEMLPEAVNPRRLELSLSKRELSLYSGDTLVKTYPVAVGKAGWETPVGEHKISAMYKDPPWRHWDGGAVIPGGDPDNPLGSRWIGFWEGKTQTGAVGVAGFHGTTPAKRSSIGDAVSHGCVRMYSEDIEELFDLVELGVTVKVVR
ncbi:L,D-transpeptidase [Lyngbya confervoides]|uniref:L,D-transpeptidase n=1 Tax=Lyngbya confervoides BDU141951 TaxID=1574623 RepID=A0ABD4SYL8_9CYAN|nr:L,D-transpeptidase [Lyngbya confervoides]MCM1981389.1 L,D-transpeptidase [Lyngbya confervoides BDU141951]